MYCLFTICSFAQKEGSVWYFGERAGLDFSSGTPVTTQNTQLNTMEGCATISNQNGNLLFYTDGITIWNHQHHIMENGTDLLGDKSSTQSAVIVPIPESTHLFFVFTVDNVPGTEGLRYSIVDMRHKEGEGKVTEKNKILYAPVTEKLTAVKHQNNKDIWILAHGHNTNAFYAYLVNSSGIFNASNPVISVSGTVHTGSVSNNAIGYMKASPDGRKLALGIRGMKLYELFDFDNATGILSNPVTFQSGDYNAAYGLEFSPDGSKLYINSSQVPTAKIYQIDLNNHNKISLVGTSASPYAGSLQVGPDGKIYFARYQSKYLGVIHHPNAAGENCMFEDDGMYLGGKFSTFGLPNFIQSYFYQPLFTFTNTCFASPTTFSITNTQNIDKVEWIFDDPVIGVNNMSDKIAPMHLFSQPGEYEVSLTLTYKDGTSRKTGRKIMIQALPTVNLGKDTLLCVGATLQLNAFIPDATYKWQNGASNSSFTVTHPGTYWVEVNTGECSLRDSIQVAYNKALQIDLGKDTTLYKVNSLLLSIDQPGVSCVWQDGSAGNTFKVTTSGTYQVQVSNGCETTTDEVTVTFVPELQVDLGSDQLLCRGQTIRLESVQSGVSYLWQDGSKIDHLIVKEPGVYWLEASNQYETLRDSVIIHYIDPPVINLGRDTVLAAGLTLTYTFTGPNTTFLWQDGSTKNNYTIQKPGIYWVEVNNTCGTVRDSIKVTYPAGTPAINLGKDTMLCEGTSLILEVNASVKTLRWQDGSVNHTFTVRQAGIYWVEVKGSFGTIRDSVQIGYNTLPVVNLGANAALCNNESLLLNARQSSDARYLWQDGSTEPELLVNSPGTYWVEISNACGIVRDSLTIHCPACISSAMPNVITPNGDGANDQFILPCINEQVWAIEIYNRWGKMVFHS